jgi:hypothetical protein
MYPRAGSLKVLLVHPGGPYWCKKDKGASSIPEAEFLRAKISWRRLASLSWDCLIRSIRQGWQAGDSVRCRRRCRRQDHKNSTFQNPVASQRGTDAEFFFDRAEWLDLRLATAVTMSVSKGYSEVIGGKPNRC